MKYFINAPERNIIPGVNYSHRDVNFAKQLLGYSWDAMKTKMKHPRKRKKIFQSTEEVTKSVTLAIIKTFKKIHLDMNILFMNETTFFLSKSQDIGFILSQVISDYNARESKDTTVNDGIGFEYLKCWLKTKH